MTYPLLDDLLTYTKVNVRLFPRNAPSIVKLIFSRELTKKEKLWRKCRGEVTVFRRELSEKSYHQLFKTPQKK